QICEYPKSPKAHFGRDLRAACPSVRKTRPRDGSTRSYVYAGIALRPEQEADAEQELPLGGHNNAPVAATTRTRTAAQPSGGPRGHTDKQNVPPTRDGANTPARERESATYRRLKSDDMPYTGPPVAVPDQGPDPLDAHGVPLAAANGGPESGLSQGRIRELA